METKFTEGPWTFCQYNHGEIVAIDKEDDEYSELICDTLITGDEEWEANAHLIAAAPDMYAMLEDMYETLCLIGDDGEETEEIKSLLAKARGEK